MDYPHPLLDIKNNKIDFSKAYSVGIGDWDKVSVAYSYSEFNNKNEERLLDSIMESAYDKGLRFITDYDARSQSGAHINAHLWDNGQDIIEELDDIFSIRNLAISNFSKFNIRKGEPYSKLEDVFVPLYFMHRYQTEAAVKLIAGMNYNYSTRGDNQLIVEHVNKKVQKDALKSIMNSLSAKHLAIPKKILELFPPRAYGYPRTRESFQSKTGVSFDPLSAAETASEMSTALLLNVERLNRLHTQHILDKTKMSVSEFLENLVSFSFGLDHKDEYLNEVQHVINLNILTYLLKISTEKKLFVQNKNLLVKYIDKINNNSYNNKKQIHEDYVFLINDFVKNPSYYDRKTSVKIPDGSPIGSESCSLNTINNGN